MPDVAEKEYDVPELISMVQDKLPRWRRRMLAVRLWINPTAVYDHATEQLCSNPLCADKAMQVFGSVDEPAKVKFKLTPDELAAFLKVLLDFITQLLPLILPLFTKKAAAPIVALLIAVGLLVGDTQAQCSGSSMASDGYSVQVIQGGGLFSRLRARRQARIASRVSHSAALSAGGYSSYGCSGSSAASYGCSGSAAASYSYEVPMMIIESSSVPNIAPAAAPVQQYRCVNGQCFPISTKFAPVRNTIQRIQAKRSSRCDCVDCQCVDCNCGEPEAAPTVSLSEPITCPNLLGDGYFTSTTGNSDPENSAVSRCPDLLGLPPNRIAECPDLMGSASLMHLASR